MTQIMHHFDIRSLMGDPSEKTALLINPPVYDTQHWAQWAQPYGLLRIAALLRKHGYKRLELYDFMGTLPNDKRKVHQHRINADESYAEQNRPSRPIRPYLIEKDGEQLKPFKYHFGKTWEEFDDWLQAQGFTPNHPPDEIFISAIMTYWWESVRDLTLWLKHRFPPSTIIVGGIYPTLVPQHAAQMTAADIVVVGEVEEANDLWTDLSLYDTPPNYAIITPSRGCPYNCAYCAQRAINNDRRTVHYRSPEDIVAEMRHKHETYGIRDFAFYADFLLWDYERNFQRILELLVADKSRYFRLHAPEGLDTRFLSESQKLADLMKAAHFKKIYLPLESIDEAYLSTMGRQHTNLKHFVQAVHRCERAGFRLRNLEVNAFVLYGLPGETIDGVVKTVLFASEIVGSIIPMLFTPVPTTRIYQEHSLYFQERGWDKNLHMLNGKIYPFLAINEGSLADYIDLQRLMFTLNAHYRSRSFQIFGETRVSKSFRDNLSSDFEALVQRYETYS